MNLESQRIIRGGREGSCKKDEDCAIKSVSVKSFLRGFLPFDRISVIGYKSSDGCSSQRAVLECCCFSFTFVFICLPIKCFCEKK